MNKTLEAHWQWAPDKPYYTLKKGALLQHTFFCLQNNTHRIVYKYTPFHVFPEHTLVSYLNTPWCVPKKHLKLCFVLVLNFTHFQVCSAERCVLSHVLMCNKAHL